MTATDPLSLLPTELRLKLYSIIFSPRPVLQIGRQWLSSSTVPTAESRERSRTHADGLPNLFSLRDHWTPYVEDAYLEGRYFTEPIYDHAYARTAMLAAKPDGRRTRDKIVLDAIGQRTGRRMDREQLPSYWNHLIRSPPIFSSLHVFHSRGSPRLQPLPRHFQSLMLLNKSFHKETVGYLYSEAVFDFGEDVDALLPFSTFIGPELADLIKYIRLDHVERLTRSGRKGTINCLNLLDIPLRTLLPNLKSLHLAISPWPHHSWAPKVPPWAMNVQELGRLLSTLDVNIRLSMGFESEIAFSDYNHHVALEANPTSKDELAQPQKNGSKPLDLNNLIHSMYRSPSIRITNLTKPTQLPTHLA